MHTETVEKKLNRRDFMRALAASLLPAPRESSATGKHMTRFKVFTLNVMEGGRGRLPEIVRLIQHTGADIVCMQELEGAGPEIASRLGFHVYKQHEDISVASRFPFVGNTQKNAATVSIEGNVVAVQNRHLIYQPYQPYQLLSIPYGDYPYISSEAEAIEWARRARAEEVSEILDDLEMIRHIPAVLTGDFNEPSWLDWTERAKRADRHPLKVAWPSTRAVAEAGFADAYRTIFPDEMRYPGYTWTPLTSEFDSSDHHDRIDFIFYRGPELRVVSADIVGESESAASIVFSPYPTDHRGVLVTFELTS